MHALKPAAVSIVLVTAVASPAAAEHLHLYGSSAIGTIFEIDRSTGQFLGSSETAVQYLADVVPDGAGGLLGLTTLASDPPNSLIRIDPATGGWTLVGTTGLDSLVEGDLAVEPATGRLYGVQQLDLVTLERSLFEIDRTTGTATLVGPVTGPAVGDLSGMAFDPAGNLLMIDSDMWLLHTVDPATAAVVSSTPLSHGLGDAAGMVFEPGTGVLYVTSAGTGGIDHLYTLDPATGALQLVGDIGATGGLWGLAFVADPLFADGFEAGDVAHWSSTVP